MSPKASLTIEIGAERGKVFDLDAEGTFYIGRDRKCDLSIPSGAVTRVHCKIEGRRGAFSITDLNSRHGTFVNDEKIQSVPLRGGDIIVVGGNRLRFDGPEPGAPPPPAKPPSERETAPERDSNETTLEEAREHAPRPAREEDDELVELRIVEPDTTLGVFFFSHRDTALRGRLMGDIEMIEPVGKGRRCTIYKGRNKATNELVAVKVLRSKWLDDEVVLRWFMKGAKRSATMSHENVVTVLGGGRDDHTLYITLELMEQNAFQRFRNAPDEGLPTVKQALHAVTMVCRALEFGCKQTKRLHGGVRPAKILFDKEGRAKLSGMGFNNRPDGPGLKDDPGPLRAYIAPEVMEREKSRDIRGDIYSLGATFFYMLTGRPPEFDNRDRVESPRKFNKAVPDSLVRIAEKTLAPSMSDRYENHAHLMHDLRWALRGEVWRPH